MMKPQSTFSPISLRYVAALRGVKPRPAGVAFTYAEAACRDPEKLICLAASNPEGRFYGLVASEPLRRDAETLATDRGIFNAVFLTGSPSETLARIGNGSALPPMLDFLCCDESAAALPAGEREALFDLAQKRLNPGGLFTTSYRAYDSDDGALHFLIRELAPEMNEDQKQEFLLEIRRLAGPYLDAHPAVAQSLKNAIVKGVAEDFFVDYVNDDAPSGTFNTMVAMSKRGFAYGGDASVTANYVELSVPVDAQDLVVSCRQHILYEPIKDVALSRTVRNDIWVKNPADISTDAAELFGGFAYGILMPRGEIPASFKAIGKKIDLSSPLYTKLIDLMSLIPIGIGDFLGHASGTGEQASKIIEAIQILVACGIATPMRGLREEASAPWSSVAQPRLVGSFNRYLDKTDLSGTEIWFASQVTGYGLSVPTRDALVMQALNRAGLNNSVSALMPELRRLAKTADALSIMEADEPTAEIAQALVRDVVGKSLPQWYAYALLEAA
ncbi:MAG: methyltransferase regulatory domain-containing protein [Alphaproteobacteria bacterium]|nr:methyltransferase regulatory domain-containing protein [Alphaproteobacteria bacterium]